MSQDLNSLPAEDVIEKFGGVRPLANRLGIAPSTVQGWKERGNIPENRIEDIMRAAQEDGIVLTFDQKQEDADQKDPANDMPATESAKAVKSAEAPENLNTNRDGNTSATAAAVAAGSAGAAATAGERPKSRFTDTERSGNNQNAQTTDATPEPEKERRDYNDRRSAGDRRQRRDPNYKGPDRRVGDRRSGIDRRQQRAAEWVHKKKFLERSMLTMASLFFIIVLVGVFLMLPEYKNLKDQAERYDQMQMELAAVNQRLENISEERVGISGRINEGLSALERARQDIMQQVETAEKITEEFSSRNWQQNLNLAEQKVYGLYTMMDRTAYLLNSPGGQEALGNALSAVESALSGTAGATTDQLQQLRTSDPVLSTVLRDIKSEDLQAAMMLLTLGQVRDSLGRENTSFDSDLELLRELGGDDPEVAAAINRLAPYAESGVLTTDTLQSEFQGLAGDIVMAKLRGEDQTVRDQAMERLSRLMTVRKTDDLAGDTPDAIVARAQMMIEQNNIEGAINELQKLDGAPADVAAPWLAAAQTRQQADQATNNLIEQILGNVVQGENLNAEGLQGLVQSLFGRLNYGAGASSVSVPSRSNGSGYPGLTSQ